MVSVVIIVAEAEQLPYNATLVRGLDGAVLVATFAHFHFEEILMAYFINDDCISCGACVPECPVDAISEGDTIYVIDADLCIDCGACASVCPVEAPTPQ